MKKLSLCILIFASISLFAQVGNVTSKDVTTVQPTILVIPFTNTGENALTLYESKFEYRAIISAITNAINGRGFTPLDLQEVIAKKNEDETVDVLNSTEIDPLDKLYRNTSADIVIKAEIHIIPENGANIVEITMKAIDKATGVSLYSSPVLSSPAFKTNDFAYIVQRLLNQDDAIGAFLSGLSIKFQKIAIEGRGIQIRIIPNENTTFNLDDETVNGDYLSDLIIAWVKANSFKNYYKIKINTNKELYFDEVRIPIKDSNGDNYSIDAFSIQVRKAISSICAQKVGTSTKPKITPQVANGVIRIYLP